MSDPRIAALEEALHAADVDCGWDCGSPRIHEHQAAAILAALPNGWCGHGVEMLTVESILRHNEEVMADLARLRRIEEAARAAVAAGWFTTNEAGDAAADALRAALEEKPQDRGEVRLPPPDPSIVGTEYGPLEDKPG